MVFVPGFLKNVTARVLFRKKLHYFLELFVSVLVRFRLISFGTNIIDNFIFL